MSVKERDADFAETTDFVVIRRMLEIFTAKRQRFKETKNEDLPLLLCFFVPLQ
jgi:hypothetical protein